MSLATIIAAVAADLEADGIEADVLAGRDQTRREVGQPNGRVVLVPIGWTYSAPGELGGGVGGNARPLAVRAQNVEAHVWARAAEQTDHDAQRLADFDAMATLADRVLRAFHRTCRGSVRWGSGEPTTGTETLEYGTEGVFTVTIGLPVTDTAWPYAPKDTTPVMAGEMKNAAGEWVGLTPAA